MNHKELSLIAQIHEILPEFTDEKAIRRSLRENPNDLSAVIDELMSLLLITKENLHPSPVEQPEQRTDDWPINPQREKKIKKKKTYTKEDEQRTVRVSVLSNDDTKKQQIEILTLLCDDVELQFIEFINSFLLNNKENYVQLQNKDNATKGVKDMKEAEAMEVTEPTERQMTDLLDTLKISFPMFSINILQECLQENHFNIEATGEMLATKAFDSKQKTANVKAQAQGRMLQVQQRQFLYSNVAREGAIPKRFDDAVRSTQSKAPSTLDFPMLSNPTNPTKPMSEHQNKQRKCLVPKPTLMSSWKAGKFATEFTLSTRLKLEKLQNTFRDVNDEVIQMAYVLNLYNVENTYQLLYNIFGAREFRNEKRNEFLENNIRFCISDSHRLNSPTCVPITEKGEQGEQRAQTVLSKPRKQEFPLSDYQHWTCAYYHEKRGQLREELQSIYQSSVRRHANSKRQKNSTVINLLERAKDLQWEILEYEKLAALCLVHHNEEHIRNHQPLDLHGFNVHETAIIFKKAIQYCVKFQLKHITFLCGKGIHSVGLPRLKRAIENMCKRNQLNYTTDCDRVRIRFNKR